jgi:hypothetical protein
MAKSIDEVKQAVDDYFADQSRTQGETAAGLRDLIEHVELQIESLEIDGE